MKTRLIAVLATSVLLGAPSAHAEVAATDTVGRVEQALGRADVPALAQLYQHSPEPVARVLAAMALERIHLDLDASTEHARLCERSLIEHQPRVALYCAQVANGNLRLSQGEAAALADEKAIIARFDGKVPGQALAPMRQFVADAVAPMQVEMPAQDFTVDLRPERFHGGLSFVRLRSHGHDVSVAVDTGASTVTLDAKTASELGVHMTQHVVHGRGFISQHVDSQLGYLDRLEIGPVTLRNVPVLVLASPRRLLGLDILRRLGAFRLGRDRLTVYRGPEHRPACQQPMLVSSHRWGNSLHAVVALPVDGTLRTTLLDSGSSFYLNGNANVVDHTYTKPVGRLGVHDVGHGRHAARLSKATSTVVIAERRFKLTYGVFRDVNLPWDYMLGSGALRDMDFYFDFQHHHTCLLLHDGLH